jgi:hypothetical protein
LLAGCGGSQTSSTGNASLVPDTVSSNLANSAANDLTRHSRLFVADNTTSQIVIYPADVHNPQPIGSISSGVYEPYDLAVDQKGTLYVQNGNNTITEYRRGQKSVSKTLTEPCGPSYTATSLTVGSDGTVYAGNSAEVFEFAGGSTEPTKTLVVPDDAFSLAIDSKNDLFVSWSVPFNNDSVVKFKPSSKVYKTVLFGQSGILAVDLHDNLLVGQVGEIAIYKPGSKTPFRKIHTAGGGKDATQFAFDSDEKYLYLASFNAGKVYVYNYKTGKRAWAVSKDLLGSNPSGVALLPAASQ